jgi:hypothetical protein
MHEQPSMQEVFVREMRRGCSHDGCVVATILGVILPQDTQDRIRTKVTGIVRGHCKLRLSFDTLVLPKGTAGSMSSQCWRSSRLTDSRIEKNILLEDVAGPK